MLINCKQYGVLVLTGRGTVDIGIEEIFERWSAEEVYIVYEWKIVLTGQLWYSDYPKCHLS